MTDPLDFLIVEDLSEELRDIAHFLGMDAVRTLLRHLSGVEVKIPSLIYYVSLCDRYIAAHYPHTKVKRIARKLGCSQEFVYSRIRQMKESAS